MSFRVNKTNNAKEKKMNKLTVKLSTIFCIGVLAINAFAQTNEEFRKKQPAPLALRPFNLPKPLEKTLPNGLKIVVVEDKRLPIVSMRLAFHSGDIQDAKDVIGLTGMMTSLLKEGTAARSSKQIAEEIEKIGGSISAYSDADFTYVSATSLSQYSDQILQLMADVTLNPSFPQKEIDLAKQNTIQGLDFQRSQPSFLANEQLDKKIWGEHPYGNTTATKVTISAITRDKLVAFHKQMFIPNNAVLVVVGNIDKAKITNDVAKLFGNWQKGSPAEANFSAPPTRTEKTLTIVNRDGSSQSNIVMANVAINRTNPDFFPMLVLNQIYGGGASSRLFMNIREDKGYTYGAYSNLDTKRLAGAFGSSAEVRNEVTGASLKEFFYEMDRIRNTPVPAQELADAKNYLTGIFPIQLETQDGLLAQLVRIQLNDLPADYLQTYRDKINSVTAADVQRVAQKYITPDKIAVVIVGDGAEILKQSKPYFQKIEIFDTEGKKIEAASFENNAAASVNVTGKWELAMQAMGQNIPLMMDLKQEGDKVTGEFSAGLLGKGTLENGKVSGNKFTGNAKMPFQGQQLNVKISGTIDGENMKGSLDIGFPGAPAFQFSGKKAQ
jgi:zinc protease